MTIAEAAGLLRRLRAQADWLGSVGSLMRFLGVAAILAPTTAAVLRSALIHFAQHVPYWSAWETRWIADAWVDLMRQAAWWAGARAGLRKGARIWGV